MTWDFRFTIHGVSRPNLENKGRIWWPHLLQKPPPNYVTNGSHESDDHGDETARLMTHTPIQPPGVAHCTSPHPL